MWGIGVEVDVLTFCKPQKFFKTDRCFESALLVDDADINSGQHVN